MRILPGSTPRATRESFTTSDTTPSLQTSYTIGAAGQPSQPTVSFSSPSAAAGARTIYTIAFTTSGSGAMSATAHSQITINFPTGTTLSTIVRSVVTDTTTGTQVGFCEFSSSTTLTCDLNSGKSIAAGDGVSIELDGVTNPPQGNVSLTVSTTSDTTASSPISYTIGAAGQPSQPSVSFSSPSGAAGARTDYVIGFTTSASVRGASSGHDADTAVTIATGEASNIKITTEQDRVFAEAFATRPVAAAP